MADRSVPAYEIIRTLKYIQKINLCNNNRYYYYYYHNIIGIRLENMHKSKFFFNVEKERKK